MRPFVHLHNHTAYSLLDGAARIEEAIARAKELNMPALAITDHGVMYGVIDFYCACKDAGIKPIIGCEVYVARRSRFDKELGRDDAPYHLVLLVKNDIGYKNLCKLVSLASLEGFYYKPRIDRELLELYHEGIIALSACLAGEIPRKILEEDMAGAIESARWHKELFGEGNYYLEIQNHGIFEQQVVNEGIYKISAELEIPLVATNDNHYVKKEDAMIQDVMLCVQTNKTFQDPNRMRFSGSEFYLKSYDEMLKALPVYKQALDNTVEIAEKCQFDFVFGQHYMPNFETPDNKSLEVYLRELCETGLIKRYAVITTDAINRLNYELMVINQMGFSAYFLIVWDFIDYARRKDIIVGPGRGSAAGSLVSYVLGITDIDPLKHGLLFERFLNPERISMPDIDIDFCFERRGEVIDYVSKKYGADHVSQIITFGTMAARGAIRDVGRVFAIPLPVVDKICKLIPNEIGITIDKAVSASDEIRQLIQTDTEVERMISIAKRLEGLPRHAGMHAAGVVISKEPMDHYAPLQRGVDNAIVTQFAKENVESIGLLKMDFLGLRTLTVIKDTLESIKLRHGEIIDLATLDENDLDTFAMLSRGDSLGVFQLEGNGLRVVLKDLKPTCLNDIIALVALYRPGPLGSGMVDDFIRRKHGELAISFMHPILEPILETTYGVILYQEQVMKIASDMGGFSMGEADTLRKAMSKKKADLIERYRDQFKDGAVNKGVSAEIADEIFSLIEKFAGYGFNKSHSAAYGVLAYQTAWLKCHYPGEYMAQLLNSFIDNMDKISFYVKECRQLGIKVLPPDINESGFNFTVVDDGIRFGLGAIKGIGESPIESIITARNKEGAFLGFQDFCLRVDIKSGINKRVVEGLILSGAFSTFGYGKKSLLSVVDACIAQATSVQKAKNSNQLSLFDISTESDHMRPMEIHIPTIEDYSESEQLKQEKKYLGIYVTGHPLDEHKQLIERRITKKVEQLTEDDDEQKFVLGGILTNIRYQTTKKGELMAYAELEDLSKTIDLLIFPRQLSGLRLYLEEDFIVLASGRISMSEDKVKMFVEKMSFLAEDVVHEEVQYKSHIEKAKHAKMKVFLRIHPDTSMNEVFSTLLKHQGTMPVYLFNASDKRTILADEQYWVKESYESIAALQALIGSENVTMR